MHRVYIVLVNWNSWRDSIECLESVFRLDYPDFRVVVCDNASRDGSLDRIAEWADGRLTAGVASPSMARYTNPPVRKPVRYARMDRAAAECGGVPGDDPELVLVDTQSNLGFAGGNNVGIRYGLARGDMGWVWLLNNDTVVDPASLTKLVARFNAVPDSGIAGSTLVYYNRPDRVQALGGASYSKWLGRARHVGIDTRLSERPADPQGVESAISYIVGASMLVSRDFLEQVGLMEESYFLYFEELDWATRAGRRFGMVWAPESLVYHKVGGSSSKRASALSLHFLFYNRLRFVRCYYPGFVPTCYLAVAKELLAYVARGDMEAARVIGRSLLGQPPALLRPRGQG